MFDKNRIGGMVNVGAFGAVFNYGSGKVIKIERTIEKNIPPFLALMGWVLSERPSYIVEVYDFGLLSWREVPAKVRRKISVDFNFDSGDTLMYTVMEKLYDRNPLNDELLDDDEYLVFEKMVGHVHPIYEDAHYNNIMFDKHGTIKLIDFGGFFDGYGLDSKPDTSDPDDIVLPGLKSDFQSLLLRRNERDRFPKGFFRETKSYCGVYHCDNRGLHSFRYPYNSYAEISPGIFEELLKKDDGDDDGPLLTYSISQNLEDHRLFDTPEEFYAKRRGKDWMDYYLEYLDSKS